MQRASRSGDGEEREERRGGGRRAARGGGGLVGVMRVRRARAAAAARRPFEEHLVEERAERPFHFDAAHLNPQPSLEWEEAGQAALRNLSV